MSKETVQRKKRKKIPIDQPHIINPPETLHDYELEQWNIINEFEEKAWSESNKGVTTGFDGIDNALEGLQTGFHIVAGDSNIGKCLVEDSLIMDVSSGRLMTIKEVYEKQQIELFTLNQYLKLEKTTPCAFIDDGIKPVYKLTTKLGREIETTASHPYLTVNGWTKLMDLKVGQHIAVPRILPVFGNYPITDTEAKLLGYLISDSTTKEKIEFINNNLELIEKLKQTYHFTIDKKLPEVAFMIPKEKMKLMLRSMFDCDGSIYETTEDDKQNGIVIKYSSLSKTLIHQVQHLLLRFGIISQIRETKDKYNTSWLLEIEDDENVIRFIDEIGFYEKEEKVKNIYNKAIKQQNMNTVTSDVYWDEIISIKYVGEKQVYDLTIPGTHNFIANDICVHNTSFLSQMAWNVATMNPDTYVIDFSLDDPMLDKLSRIIASGSKVLINAVKNPKNYLQYPKMLERRAAGLRQLRKMVHCYKAYDQNHGTDVDIIKDTIKRHIVELKEAGEKRKVVVFIDNFHDLTTIAKEAQGSDKNKFDYLAQFVSDMATEFDIPIVCSAEFKKLNGFRRPSIDDIRESVKIKYEAKSIMLCYNEVSLKGEGASVYFEKAGDPAKQPVFEVKFAKNKYSKFKGRVYFEGYPEMAYFVEADEESTKRYNNVIYSNE